MRMTQKPIVRESKRLGTCLRLGVGISLSMALACAAFMGCGLIGGGGDEKVEDPIQKSTVLQTIEAKREAGGDDQAGISSGAMPTTVPVALSKDTAQKLLWVYLSQCITFESTDIEASQVSGEWYVRAKLQSPYKTGLWRIAIGSKEIEPYDSLAEEWKDLIQTGCDPDRVTMLTTPRSYVTNESEAAVVLWSYLITCFSDLKLDEVVSRSNPVQGEWIVATEEVELSRVPRPINFGVWTLNASTAVLKPKDGLAQRWQAYIASPCAPDLLEGILPLIPVPSPTETPFPTATPPVTTTQDAVTAVWAYLVSCYPHLQARSLSAATDPSSGDWIVTQPADLETGPPIWTVNLDGRVSPRNVAAESKEARIKQGDC